MISHLFNNNVYGRTGVERTIDANNKGQGGSYEKKYTVFYGFTLSVRLYD